MSFRTAIRLLVFMVAVACVCSAQEKATSAGATGSTQSKSPYIVASDSAPADVANRKALEEHAGPDGGKLLVRSVPSGARVFVNDSYVGHAPLLLIVAPGAYKIQVQGAGEASAEKTVNLGPKDTQEVALALTARYPDRVTAR